MHQLPEYITYTSNDLATDESFQNYVFGKREEDITFWQKWLNQYPEKRILAGEAAAMLTLLKPNKKDVPAGQQTAELNRLFATIGEAETASVVPMWLEPVANPEEGTNLTGRYRRWYYLVAVFTGLLLLAGAGYFYRTGFFNQNIRYQTAFGQNTSITLPDNSVVILNGNTRLSHRKGWDETNTREVWLEGEAFFEVKHNPRHTRFVVHTPQVDVVVLGTRFNVFNRDDKTDVVLNSGKVKVNIKSAKDTSTLILLPGEKMEYFRKKQKVVKQQVNAEVLTSWRNHLLVLEDTPLYKIAEIIEYTYGVDVIIKDKDQFNQKLAGTLPSDNLDVLLLALAKSSNLNISRTKNKIFIESNKLVSEHEK
jgi:transmembrane sensor